MIKEEKNEDLDFMEDVKIIRSMRFDRLFRSEMKKIMKGIKEMEREEKEKAKGKTDHEESMLEQK